MNICIIGTARSGTTAIYTLLQKIVVDNFPKVKFYYEPFLWDINELSGLYEEVNEKFNLTSSLSHEGIYNHLKLPLFIEEPTEYLKNEYLSGILHQEENTVKLAKFIRANGRVWLMAKIDPDCKFIFITRNPLDVINSLKDKFSFFGGEFYREDYTRFIHDINKIYNADINLDETLSYQEKLLLYWKYMNLFALESLKSIKNDSLLLCQEELSADPAGILKSICHFLQIPLDDKYLAYAVERKSEVTSEFIISKKELDKVFPFLDAYFNMLKEFNIQHRTGIEDIVKKYVISAKDIIIPNSHYGKNALTLAKIASDMSKDLTLSRTEIVKLSDEILLLKQQLSTLLSQQKGLMDEITKVQTELRRIKNKRLFRLLNSYLWK